MSRAVKDPIVTSHEQQCKKDQLELLTLLAFDGSVHWLDQIHPRIQ